MLACWTAVPEPAAQAFGRLDRDRNGLLDTAELAEAISQFLSSPDLGSYGSLAVDGL